MDLKNCPREYYINCSHALVHCKSCSAGKGRPTMRLMYKPINDLGPHPYSTKGKDRAKQKRQREAKNAEKVAAETIAKLTLGSGAVRGDGDFHVLESIRVEHKDRGERNCITVTTAELKKGWAQQIQAFAITYTHPVTQRKRTAYVIDEELMGELLGHEFRKLSEGEV